MAAPRAAEVLPCPSPVKTCTNPAMNVAPAYQRPLPRVNHTPPFSCLAKDWRVYLAEFVSYELEGAWHEGILCSREPQQRTWYCRQSCRHANNSPHHQQ